jgi:hypothetical protein
MFITISVIEHVISCFAEIELVNCVIRLNKTIRHATLSNDRLWLALSYSLACSVCMSNFRIAARYSSLDLASYWLHTTQALLSQRKLRRQYGLLVANQIFINFSKSQKKSKSEILDLRTLNFRNMLDGFLAIERHTLLSNSYLMQHWHDLSTYDSAEQRHFQSIDKVCSPSLIYQNVCIIP